MTLKQPLSLQALKLLREFKKKNKEVFDIAIYGSAIRGKTEARDMDFVLIFLQEEKLEKKLSLAQQLKNMLEKSVNLEIDVKSADIKDLLDSSFLARKAIIAEGFLVLKGKFLNEVLGFENFYIFSYSLGNLKPSKKVMFQYAMRGRRGSEGLLELTKSTLLGKGVVKVPLQHAEEFKEFLEKNKVSHKILKGLYY